MDFIQMSNILFLNLCFFITRPNHGRDFAATQDLSRFGFYQNKKIASYFKQKKLFVKKLVILCS